MILRTVIDFLSIKPPLFPDLHRKVISGICILTKRLYYIITVKSCQKLFVCTEDLSVFQSLEIKIKLKKQNKTQRMILEVQLEVYKDVFV